MFSYAVVLQEGIKQADEGKFVKHEELRAKWNPGVKIKWTKVASQDLDSIYDYIEQDNPTAAVDVVIHIMDSVENLIPQNTDIGRAGRILGTRELIITKYLYIVPYRILNNEIEIIRVYTKLFTFSLLYNFY